MRMVKCLGLQIWVLLAVCVSIGWIAKVAAQASSQLTTETSYTPTTNLLINCGSSSNATVPNVGTFISDGSPYVSVGILAKNDVPTNTDDDPFPALLESARLIENSPATYKIPVANVGRVWLRLWFYPITYSALPSYDPSTAKFSVVANGFTLLYNLTAHDIQNQKNGMKYMFKEYLINVTTESLSIVFTPQANSFAFINGLAVVSLPSDLLNSKVSFVPSTPITLDLAPNALETVYRLNVGGDPVTPSNDSFLTRTWESDDGYLIGALIGVKLNPVSGSSINYPQGVPKFIAPSSVYSTARTLGSSATVNSFNNLTWRFPIDPGYEYYVRLHFDEILYTAINQRVFKIYLNNQTAVAAYDPVAAASAISLGASFQDFIVSTSNSSDPNLWVALGTQGPQSTSQFDDVILNGLEVFKINNTQGSLQATSVVVPASQGGSSGKKSGSNMGTIIGAAVGGIVVLAVFVGICFFWCCRRSKGVGKQPGSPAWLPLPIHGGNSETSTVSHKSGTGSYVSSATSNLGRHFTFSELQDATNNFDEDLLLGVGGFGKVYKADIDDGMLVAVKRGNPRSEQGLTEFQTEIELLSKLRHRHLVSLIGYCEEHCEMILVYDYMANGPLRGHLYGTDLPPLSWKQRLEICVGAARGLHYLHTGAAQGIIHRDVKTTNILLDDNLVAKVADFGLSKTGPSLDRTHVSTAVKGSFGYLDPEYFRRQQLTEKSDVYSFGVVLMEVVCARPAINPALPREQVSIAEWAMQWQKMGMLEQIIDPRLAGYINPDSLRKFGETAEKCLAENGIDRPAMGDVLWNLEYALQLQENSVENRLMDSNTHPNMLDSPLGSPDGGDEEEPDVTRTMTNTSLGSDEEEDSVDASASAVFSQLVNPQGR